MFKDSGNICQSKVAFLVPFFGKKPTYFDWWAKSCEHNSANFHWYVYNDHVDSKIFYNKSVTIIPLQFGEMIKSFKNILNLNIVNNVRRVCDYRILFPVIRMKDDSLCGYDFYGYTDIDVIYGNFIKFIGDDFYKYSIISGNYNRPCGPFTMINRMCFDKIINSEVVRRNIESFDHHAFDESIDLKDIVVGDGECLCDPDPIQPALTKNFNHRKTFCVWDKGSLDVYDNRWNRKNGAFYHFSRYKNKKRFRVDTSALMSDSFCVYKYGIVPYKSIMTKFFIRLSLLY